MGNHRYMLDGSPNMALGYSNQDIVVAYPEEYPKDGQREELFVKKLDQPSGHSTVIMFLEKVSS